MSEKIKAIVLTSTSGSSDFSNLQLKEENYPKIESDDQVIVRVKASGLNFAELMQRQGFYKPASKTPYTPGFEAAGVVEEIGAGVTDLQVNDRVIIYNGSGMWKEVVCLARSNLIKMPDAMSFEDGAALMVNYLTAYQILFRMVNIRQGDKVLIHMAAGGVGFAATQLCKTVNDVTVIGTASSAKHEAITQNGVVHCIDYTKEDYVQEVKKLYPLGIDVVLDPLNGENAIKGYELLKPFGRICHYGAASITSESRSFVNAFKAWWKCLSVTSLDIINQNKSMCGYHLGFLMNNPSCVDQMSTDISNLLEMYNKGLIRIQHDSTFGYSKIAEAMKRMHSRQNVGKIILKPDGEIEKESPRSVEEVKVATEEKVEQTQPEQSKEGEQQPEEVSRSEISEAHREPVHSEQIEHETSKLNVNDDQTKNENESIEQTDDKSPADEAQAENEPSENQPNEN